MSLKLLFITILGTLMLSTACVKTITKSGKNKAIEVKKTVSNDPLVNCWRHSYEEDSKTYRPCSFKKFPLSRFRAKFDLSSDGKAKYLFLAPNDGHYMKDGTWTYSPKTNKLIIRNIDNKIVYKYLVVNLAKEKLLLTRLSN